MVKTLQKKFIITAMIAITVLLVVTLGAVNVFNISRLRNEMNNTLTMLVENDGMRPWKRCGYLRDGTGRTILRRGYSQ
ncbi:hypothetical protein DXC24_12590 [Clostridium sp. OM08-29]|nr:hypothetical protein DW062_11560 [Clostridium sp. AF43-10]RHU83662.1 hypothetical protein DXC24_12590 [Clostridium sp. OM08-29]